MMDWLATQGGIVVMIFFMALFLGFAFWAFAPANKKKFEQHGQIPLKEIGDVE